MNEPLFSIIIPVRNGYSYLDYCLSALLNQDYKGFEVAFFDNNSTDDTLKKVKFYQVKFEKEKINFKIIKSPTNYFVGGAFNRAYLQTKGKYIMLLCIDVILKNDFLRQALAVFRSKPKVGAIQAKVYSFDISKLSQVLTSKFEPPSYLVIDTCGFRVFRSRRIINIGHGEVDYGQFNKEMEIFGVEGACPVFRRRALEDIKFKRGKIDNFFDEDMMWYGDDLDLAWRLNLFGWRQIFSPNLIAYHDRKTTKTLSSGFKNFVEMRKKVPALKKILDYRNTRLAFVKNEDWTYFKNDLMAFLKRELLLLGYFFIFEPRTFWFGLFSFLKLLPPTWHKRKLTQKKILPQNLKYIYQNLIQN